MRPPCMVSGVMLVASVVVVSGLPALLPAGKNGTKADTTGRDHRPVPSLPGMCRVCLRWCLSSPELTRRDKDAKLDNVGGTKATGSGLRPD